MEEDTQRQFSALGQNLLAGQDDPSGDPLIKKIFSNREVLAWLVVHFINEYKKISIQEVVTEYLPNAKMEIRKIPVHAGEVQPESVRTDNVEDRQLAERTTVFDVVLLLPAPNHPDRSIGVVIDIEVQKNDLPGYPIESRMVYYLCRTISRQRGVTFTGSDYGDICKCYSLWFCPELEEGKSPSIDHFFLAGERVYGEGNMDAKKEDYELLEGYIVRFNGNPTKPVNDTIRYLQLLLTDIASPLERLDELHEKYGLSKTREAEDMCNYSQYLVEQGIKQGIEQGIEKEKLELLERMDARHYSDVQIMDILQVSTDYLKVLRIQLQKRLVAMADD